jgi:HAE1 family hydrophobic/amphiphilic exporter-1
MVTPRSPRSKRQEPQTKNLKAEKAKDQAAMDQAPLLARLSLTQPIFVTSIVLLMLFLGFLSYSKLGVDLFPEIEIPVVTVVVPYRGAGPAEIESLVVKPLEEELASLGGVKRVLATCGDGFGQIVCQFYTNTDMKNAEQQVRNRVANVRGKLPREIDEPQIARINFSDQPVVEIGLETDLPPAEAYDLAKEEIKNRFEQVPGVGRVDLAGGRRREIQVLLDRGTLKEKGVSGGMVAGRIGENSSNVPVGKVTRDGQDVSFRTIGEYRGLDQIENAVVSFYDRPVRVRDLGAVVDGQEDAKTLAFVNGRPAILIKVFKQTGTNTVQVSKGVLKQLDKLNEQLKPRPGKPKLTALRDGALWINQNVDDVKETIAIGILLVIVVVYFFLGNFRSTFITGLALPNSLLGAFILMNMAGFTINIMTLLAMSLSVGLLIDDAIVVRENIFRHIERGESAWRAALLGTREVNLAVIATSAVVIAVFLPVGFLGGTVGKFLAQFGLTMCFAMVISLFDAITIAPMLSAYFAGKAEHEKGSRRYSLGGVLGGAVATGIVGSVLHGGSGFLGGALVGGLLGGFMPMAVQPFERFQTGLEAFYGRVLSWVLKHRLATLGLATLIFILSFVAAGSVSKTFIPASDSTEFGVWIEMPEGTSLEQTGEVALEVDKLVRAHKEVDATSITVDGNKAAFFCNLVLGSKRNLTSQELKTIVRAELAKGFPGANPSVGDIDVGGNNEKPFTLVLKGDDLKLLSAYADKLKALLAKDVKGLVDLDSSYREGKPEFQVKLDPLRAGRLGVSTVTAGMELRVLTDGAVAGKYRENGREYDIRVRLKEDQRDLEKGYGATWVPNLNNNLVRLSSVSTSKASVGPSAITRRDRSRSVVIVANLGAGGGLGDVIDGATKIIAANPPPAGVSYDFVGQAEDFADLGKSMLTAIVLAVVIMYLVLASLYGSFITPVTIMLALPLAMAGAFYALAAVGFLSDKGVFKALNHWHLFHVNRLDASLNLFSMIGLVLLLGLVAKNSILLVDLTLQHIREGMERDEAVHKAGLARLRPILMTSLALLFGTLPLALALNEAGRFRSSMGVGIAGGLISSTLLTLVVVPAAFEYIDDFRVWFEGLFRKLGGRK